MDNKVTIMASNGGIFNAYKVFNMAVSAALMKKEVSIFFNFDAIKFVVKPEFYNFNEVTLDFKNKIKNYGVTPINELIKTCQKFDVKFFVIPYGMKMADIEEDQLLEGIVLAGETTFLDNAQDSVIVLNF